MKKIVVLDWKILLLFETPFKLCNIMAVPTFLLRVWELDCSMKEGWGSETDKFEVICFRNFPECAVIISRTFCVREITVSWVGIGIFRGLRDAVRRNRPENCRTDSWFLLYDNAPAHRSVLVKGFVAKTMWQHWSISHTLLRWLLLLIFTCYLDWNQGRDRVFVMPLT